MIHAIAEQVLIMLPLAFGAYVTISLLKLPDFSLESAFLFGAVMAYVAKELPLPCVLLSAMGGGMLVALVVSVFNQVLGIPFLIAAIITNGLFHGLTQCVLGTSVTSFHPFESQTLALFVSLGLTALLFFALKSQLGISLAIFGNNPHFFSNHRMSGRYVVILGVLLGHALAAMSGFLFAHANGFVDLTMNFGIILLCISSLMLGKLVIKRAKPSILLPLSGIVAFFVIQQLLLHLGMNLKYYNAFQALFVLLVLFLGQKRAVTFDHLGV